MYETLPGDVRSRHPFHMYDEIRLQPEAIARSLAIVDRQGREFTDTIRRAHRVVVTGCGTSFHVARLGAYFLEAFSEGSIDARGIQAFEFVTYGPDVGMGDVVIGVSHSGTSAMTIRALERAASGGANTLLVTGFTDAPACRSAEMILATGYNEERSWAHTVSYTAALTSLAGIANFLAAPHRKLDLAPLPDVVADVLGLEDVAHRMAASVLNASPDLRMATMLVGAGPNAVTAAEGALKVLETSYGHATAFELEELLHGPLAAVGPEDAIIVIAPPGGSTDRAARLCAALLQLGVTPVVLCGDGNADAFPDAHRLAMPDVPEVLSPIPLVVPLQLFSYFLAVGKGINPDLIHRDDQRQRAARAKYE